MRTNFKYPALIQSIPTIRQDLQVLAGEWGLPGGELKQLLLIIEELFSNIIRYSYDDPKGEFIGLELILDASSLMIRITDKGRAFNPLEYKAEESDDPVEVTAGGMGIILLRAFSESMEYKREKDKNILILRKNVFF